MNLDPKKAQEAVSRLKAAFQKAAAADTGPAKELFKKLSDDFSNTLDQGMEAGRNSLDPEAMKSHMAGAVQQIQSSFAKAAMAARTNPKAMKALVDLQKDVMAVVRTMTSGNKPPKPPSGGNLNL